LAGSTTITKTIDIDSTLVAGATLNSFGFYAMDFAPGRPAPVGWAVDSLAYGPNDTTAPTAAPTLSPKANAAGWNKADVTIKWNWSDKGGDGIDPAHCTKTTKVTTEGTHTLTATCKDLAGNQDSASWKVKLDKTPPTCTASASPNGLSPADHRLVNIATMVKLTDGLSGPDVFRLVSVTSNQADSGLGAGDLANDKPGWTISSADTSGRLRAERYGSTRIYIIKYRATDKAGNQKVCSAAVSVP
jgi:endo-alpha-N-acetylgalactosaminidase